MKKKLAFKNLLSLAWADLVKHFIDWLFLFGVQVLVLVGFLLCCAIILLFSHLVFLDYSKLLTVAVVSIISIFSLLMYIVYPIMYKQNALDATFHRSLSGFDINNRFFSYAVTMYVYWVLVIVTSGFFFVGLFLAQRWRFVGLHILEHGGNVRQAFKASWRMTRGYVWFFIGVSLIQWLIWIFCACTIVGLIAATILCKLVDAQMYKQLHVEVDKGNTNCSSCEV